MPELSAHSINPELDEFWDEDHALRVVFTDGSEDDYSVPSVWCWMERSEVVQFVIQWFGLSDVDLELTQCING